MQNKEIYLTIDIGSSTIKAALFSKDGVLIAEEKESISQTFIHNFSKFNTSSWITKLCSIITTLKERMVSQSKSKAKSKITAICISGNGPTLVPIDYAGNIVCSPLFWINDASKRIKDCESYFLSMVKEFKDNHPKWYKETESFLTSSEYIAYLLTGEKYTVIPTDEYQKYYWDLEQAEKYDVEIEKFPPFLTTGDEIGKVSRKGGKIFEVNADATVYAGAPDFISCLLGCGAINKDTIVNRTGTSEALNMIVNSKDRLETDLPHIIKNRYIRTKYLQNTGYQFDKFCKINYGSKCDYSKIIEQLLSKSSKNEEEEYLKEGRTLIKSFISNFKKSYKALNTENSKIIISGGQTLNSQWLSFKEEKSSISFKLPPLNAAELLGNLIIIKVAKGDYPDYKSAISDLVEYHKV